MKASSNSIGMPCNNQTVNGMRIITTKNDKIVPSILEEVLTVF